MTRWVLLVLLGACVTPVPAPAPPVSGASCEDACATMERLSYPTRDCVATCSAAAETSSGLAWDTECIAAARSVDEVDACTVDE